MFDAFASICPGLRAHVGSTIATWDKASIDPELVMRPGDGGGDVLRLRGGVQLNLVPLVLPLGTRRRRFRHFVARSRLDLRIPQYYPLSASSSSG